MKIIKATSYRRQPPAPGSIDPSDKSALDRYMHDLRKAVAQDVKDYISDDQMQWYWFEDSLDLEIIDRDLYGEDRPYVWRYTFLYFRDISLEPEKIAEDAEFIGNGIRFDQVNGPNW